MPCLRSASVALLVNIIVLGAVSSAQADVIFADDFDALTTGPTQPAPGNPAHGGWFNAESVSPSFGEIQSIRAVSGNALHQFSSQFNENAQQITDQNDIGAFDVSNSSLLSISFDFFSSSSNLDVANSYEARISARSGDGISEILGVNLSSGNGTVKREDGIDLSVNVFNGTDNNVPISPISGQNLSWDTWHTVTLIADPLADRYVSIAVDGSIEDLSSLVLPRFGTPRVRSNVIELLDAQVVAHDNFGAETDDELFTDNLRVEANNVSAIPEPSSLALYLLAGMVFGSVRLARFSRKLRSR